MKPATIRRVNFWLTIAWCVWFVPAVAVERFRSSVLLVAVYSIYANVVSHYTAYLASRVDTKVED